MRELSGFDLVLSIVVVVLGASGSYLLLPHRFGAAKPARVHAAGGVLAGLALLAFLLFWKPPGPFLTGFFFYAFALAAVAGGAIMVTSRDPIHSALWFAAVVLATSGLFLIAGAQFLAAGTVIVYAGAIIVTFLFVIMLAQMEGRATYDRAARAPGRATFTCFLLFWGLLYALLTVRAVPTQGRAVVANAEEKRLVRTDRIVPLYNFSPGLPASRLLRRAVKDTSRLNDAAGLPKPHVAGLGESLYTDNLIVVELAGALLFVALIGALSIAAPKPPIRPGKPVVVPAAGVGPELL
jgi:NADH-quinone oxidoreductase subunit J